MGVGLGLGKVGLSRICAWLPTNKNAKSKAMEERIFIPSLEQREVLVLLGSLSPHGSVVLLESFLSLFVFALLFLHVRL